MFKRLERSWKLIKGSFKLIKENPSLFLFPLMSSLTFIACIAILLLIFTPAVLLKLPLEALIILAILLIMFISPFIGTFYAVGLSFETGEVLKGKKVSLKRGVRHALKNIKEVALWAVTLFAINIIQALLRQLVQKYGGGRVGQTIGNSVIDILLAGWSFATAFVIPIMAFEDTNPFDSIKKSVQLLKHTWGETLVGYVGAGSLLWLFLIPLVLLIFIPYIGLFFIPILILGVIIISFLVQVFDTVFMTALYIYATEKDEKKAEKYFDKDLIAHGFY
ncbi:hypothetical protein HZA98_04795 [Candidatus Woesearchaeota archaeon]|nr:hypothetical protein [Candidatus Woesearchaeota archaeon]